MALLEATKLAEAVTEVYSGKVYSILYQSAIQTLVISFWWKVLINANLNTLSGCSHTEKGFSLGSPVFLPPQKPTLQIPIQSTY